MVSHHSSSDDVQSKRKQHRINRRLLRFCQMCSILIGYKNWWSYGHLKTLVQMNCRILGTCGNQYYTGTVTPMSPNFFDHFLIMIQIDHTLSNFWIHRSFELIIDLTFSNLLLSVFQATEQTFYIHLGVFFTYFTRIVAFLSTHICMIHS